MRIRRSPLIFGLVLLVSRIASAQQAAADKAPLEQLVSRYCVDCHSSEDKAAGLALDALVKEEVSGHLEAWEKVARKLRARQMPPAKSPRPNEETYKRVLAGL